jgi:anti-sigma factor RsiW
MTVHNPEDLTAHALGLLDGPSARAVEGHLSMCPDCRREWADVRETAAMIGSVPAETLVDGPPMGDFALRRALRQIREETTTDQDTDENPIPLRPSRRGAFRPALLRGIAAAAAAIALLGGGAVVGRLTAPDSSTVATAEGRTVQGSQGSVEMTATLTPAAGWVRLAAKVQGLAPNQKCTLLLIAQDGTTSVAGSWITGTPKPGTTPSGVNGSAIIDPATVRAVAVRNDAGQTLISVPVPAGV